MERKQRILIADDDIQLVNAARTLLEQVGYDVIFTHKSAEIIELARKEDPDLILLDVMFAGIPGPDGFEISRKLHKDPQLKNIPVIILSGVKRVLESNFTIEPDEEWMPVKTFLDKPIKPEQLLGEIRKLIR